MSYVDAWVKQKSHFLARTGPDRLDPVGDGVMFVEHEPVYTVGRGGTLNNLKFDALAPGDGPACLRVDRGGEVTWHGPGQLVVYPLLALPNFKKDIRWFVCRVEDVIIGTAAQYGLKAHRMEVSSRNVCPGRREFPTHSLPTAVRIMHCVCICTCLCGPPAGLPRGLAGQQQDRGGGCGGVQVAHPARLRPQRGP